MSRSIGKAEALLQMEQLLLNFPEGVWKAEIARRLGVHRSTVGRWIDELSKRVPIWERDNLVGIDRDSYLNNVRLTLHESMALHLAARLLATRMDRHNPHAASALRKVGSSLQRIAPMVSQHLSQSAQMMEDAGQRQDPAYLNVLETLTRAWSEGNKVHLWHRSKNGKIYEYDYSPYFIEPYAIGQTTHVIGYCEPMKERRTFKLEQIERIEPLRIPYTIPADFDPRELLADAWGIWYTDKDPEEVVLKFFHPQVVLRVQQTRWHRSEKLETLQDGSLIWRAMIAEPQEMLPWIRGWGADCEVLGPEWLRDEMMGEARRIAALYGWNASSSITDGANATLSQTFDDFFGGKK